MGETLLINTDDGPVRGVKKISLLGNEYISFQGIPYAEPPFGKLRFCVSILRLNDQIVVKKSMCCRRIRNRLNLGRI